MLCLFQWHWRMCHLMSLRPRLTETPGIYDCHPRQNRDITNWRETTLAELQACGQTGTSFQTITLTRYRICPIKMAAAKTLSDMCISMSIWDQFVTGWTWWNRVVLIPFIRTCWLRHSLNVIHWKIWRKQIGFAPVTLMPRSTKDRSTSTCKRGWDE
jgi:hypothetical protein